MLTLSRGVGPLWMNPEDAKNCGVKDNDWVEIINDHGVAITRAVLSDRVPKGLCML